MDFHSPQANSQVLFASLLLRRILQSTWVLFFFPFFYLIEFPFEIWFSSTGIPLSCRKDLAKGKKRNTHTPGSTSWRKWSNAPRPHGSSVNHLWLHNLGVIFPNHKFALSHVTDDCIEEDCPSWSRRLMVSWLHVCTQPTSRLPCLKHLSF